MTKKPRLGSDPFKEEPLSFIRDSRKDKLNKPSNTDNISKPSKPRKTQKEASNWKRATFIVREDHLEKIRALAYWERLSKTRVLDLALESYLKRKKIKSLPKESE